MKKRRAIYPRLVLAVLIVLVMMSSATVISEARQIGFVEYTRNLTVGSIGDDVLWVQRFLNETRGAGLEEDGIYGNSTRNAVTAFQSAYGLEADGIVGQLTLGRMQEVWHDKLEEEARQSIQAPPKVVNVTGVEVTPNVRTMKKGESYRFMITVQPSNATDKSVTLTSSNPSVAKVSSDGTVTALSAGTAVIRAKAGNKTGATTITVEEEFKGKIDKLYNKYGQSIGYIDYTYEEMLELLQSY